MADITLSGTDTEVFGGAVLEAYQHRDYIQEEWMMFQGMTAGEVVNVPVFAEAEAENRDDGDPHNGSAQIDGVEVALVDPIKAFVDIKKTQVDVRPDLNLLTHTGRALGRAVGYGRTLRIANHLIHEADLQGNSFTDDFTASTTALTSTAVITGMASIGAAMDDDGVDTDGRYGLMKPTQWYAVRGEVQAISRDFTQGQNVNQAAGGNMSLWEYLGFEIRNTGGIFGTDWTASAEDSRNLPTDTGKVMAHDNTAVIGVFWQADCAVVRHQTGLEANVDWIHRDQVWMPIARLHMGVKVIKTQGVYILIDQSPT